MNTPKRAIGWRSGMVSLRIAVALVGFITVTGRSQPVGNGDGLLGSYFDNRHLSGTPVTNRVEAQVDFDWGLGAPAGLTYPDEFGARWTGELQAQYTEPYTLSVETDDGARVWLNEQLIIDDWVDRPAPEATVTVNLIAGQKYLLRLDYYENHLYAGIRCKWSSPSTPKQIVPQSQLYSVPTDADHNGLPDLWEIAHFGRVGVNPAGDDDLDGLTNLAEYRRHNDPLAPLNRGVPNEWMHGNLGSAIGDASYTNGVFTVTTTGRAAKNDIGGSADAFHFFYQPLDANGQVVARVLRMSGVGGVGSPAKVGVMVRLTLNDNSPYAALIGFGTNSLAFQERSDVAHSYLPPPALPNTPYWLKAVRWSEASSGYDSIAGYYSPDGTNWTRAGLLELPAGIKLPQRVYVGLAVASPQPDSLVTVQFDQAVVTPVSAEDLQRGTPMVGTGDGLTGRYYSNPNLSGTPVMTRVDPLVNFNWRRGVPGAELPDDLFSVAWTGEIQAQYTEAYTLYFKSDDGVRVRLDDQLIINNWVVGINESSATVNLTAGQKYLLHIEYYENHGAAQARLGWSSPSTPKRIVPKSQLYSQFTDADRDGLPDIWEKLHFGHLGFGPGDDPDGDRVANLQEYQAHTNPKMVDTDGDGLPDGWEIAHGLNPLDPADAAPDNDFDGLSNQQEFHLGTDPNLADSDGDGVPDGLEVNYAHTDPLTADPGLVTEVTAVNGAEGMNFLGRWEVAGNDLLALDRRGSVDFVMTNGSANKFLLQIEGTESHPLSSVQMLDLLVSIDGESLGHRPLPATHGTNGIVEYVTPFLKRGKHTVRVFWDGAASLSKLRIKTLHLQSIAGPDHDRDGINDWVEAMLNAESGRDTNAALSSYVSPLCLEGRDPYLSMMNLRIDSANARNLPVRPNSGQRWYADVPLAIQGDTLASISFQNGAVVENCSLRWLPVNVLTGGKLLIRAGDSLLLTARASQQATVQLTITKDAQTVTNYATVGNRTVPHRFDTVGTYTASAILSAPSGGQVSGSMAVRVVDYRFPGSPVCWAGKTRDWALTNVPAEIVLDGDPRLKMTPSTNTSASVRALNLLIDQNEPRTIVSRLETNGPILETIRAEGIRLFATPDTFNTIIETYPDRSRLVETMAIISPVLTNVTVQISIIVGGVTFDDGTTYRELTTSDFDTLGQCTLHFLMPAGVQTANCHRIVVMQGAAKVGSY